MLILFVATLSLCPFLTQASVVTGFNTENNNWVVDDGEDGLTYIDVFLIDESPILIDFNGSWQSGKKDEEFAITLWNLTGTYLVDLHLRWEKQDIDLSDAPISATDLNLQFSAREINSAILTDQNNGTDFHELWFDFIQGMGAGIILIDFDWLNFNDPVGDFKLFIDVSLEETNPVPIPGGIWLFFTCLLATRVWVKTQQ